MHPTTLLAHHGLVPLPRPAGRPRTAAAPRRRPLRAAPRIVGEPRAVRRWLTLRPRLSSVGTAWRAAAVALVLALAVGGLGGLRVWPPFAVVMSGSMAPTINTGDLIVLERLRAPARIGEVVAVDVPDAARARYGYPPVVIHRVHTITPDGQIRTKGDARPQPDPFTVPRTAVDTKVIARIPSGGRVLAFFHSAPGLLWLAFGGLLFLGLPLLEHQREGRRREVYASADLHDQLAAVTAELACLRAEQARSRAAADATLSQLDRLAQLVERTGGPAGPAPAAGEPTEVSVVTLGANGLGAPAHTAQTAPATPDGDDASRASADEACLLTPPQPLAPVMAIRVSGRVVPPAAARGVPAAPGRWDAPPSGTSTCTTGWASSPVPVATRRFSRTGRLVAASQA